MHRVMLESTLRATNATSKQVVTSDRMRIVPRIYYTGMAIVDS